MINLYTAVILLTLMLKELAKHLHIFKLQNHLLQEMIFLKW